MTYYVYNNNYYNYDFEIVVSGYITQIYITVVRLKLILLYIMN